MLAEGFGLHANDSCSGGLKMFTVTQNVTQDANARDHREDYSEFKALIWK
jgi:hypothetical protein